MVLQNFIHVAIALTALATPAFGESARSLPGTTHLQQQGDIASQLVDGVNQFLLSQIESSIELRKQLWNRDFTSQQAYKQSIEPNRRRLAQILGIRDARVAFDSPEFVAAVSRAW